MGMADLFTYAGLMLEAQRRNVPATLAARALEDAVVEGVYTVIGITEDGDFIYKRVPREERAPLLGI